MNLISVWRESLKARNVTLSEAVRQMNCFTRLKTRPGHISEMAQGKKNIPVLVHNYILNEVFFYLSGSNLTIMEIKDYLVLPEREK